VASAKPRPTFVAISLTIYLLHNKAARLAGSQSGTMRVCQWVTGREVIKLRFDPLVVHHRRQITRHAQTN
jgi:hypothetical protein